MKLLSGQYTSTLDEKGRVMVPAKIRSTIESSVLIVTQAIVDHCLWLFTPDEWAAISSKVMEAASPFSAKNRLVMRSFISPAQEIEVDKSGRLSIPQSLRTYASLSKECIILGAGKYFELWDSASYENYLLSNEDNLLEASEELSQISF